MNEGAVITTAILIGAAVGIYLRASHWFDCWGNAMAYQLGISLLLSGCLDVVK